jgi:hypothetical protein
MYSGRVEYVEYQCTLDRSSMRVINLTGKGRVCGVSMYLGWVQYEGYQCTWEGSSMWSI